MNVPRDVILDLAPIYLTGEASAATRELVDDYLRTDPDLARWMTEQRVQTFDRLEATPPADLELRALRRVRTRLGLQRWMFGLGWFFLALALSVEFRTERGRIVEFHFLARDYPAAAVVCLVLMILCWGTYAALRRKRHGWAR
jgi:hypothetical protein